MRNVMQV
jgi:hypothetical protein